MFASLPRLPNPIMKSNSYRSASIGMWFLVGLIVCMFIAVLQPACAQATPQAPPGWSSAEFIRGNDTSIIAMKELAGTYPVKFLPNIRASLDSFAGYGVKSQKAVAGLAVCLSGPLSGRFRWLVGVGDVMDLSKPLNFSSFDPKGFGAVVGLSFSL